MSIGYVWLVLYRCLLGGKGLRGMVMVTEYCTVRGCISVGGVNALGVEGKKVCTVRYGGDGDFLK